jgi:hypothetical protein
MEAVAGVEETVRWFEGVFFFSFFSFGTYAWMRKFLIS